MRFKITYLHNYMGMNVIAMQALVTLPKDVVTNQESAMQYLLLTGGFKNETNDGTVIGNFVPVTAIIGCDPA
jgi:hypothetical protein